MDNQINHSNTQANHSHKKYHASIGLSLGAAVLLLVVVTVMIISDQSASEQSPNTPEQNTTAQAPASDIETQMQQVTPEPINSKQDLDKASQTLDSTDMNQVSTGLNQNNQAAATFSQ